MEYTDHDDVEYLNDAMEHFSEAIFGVLNSIICFDDILSLLLEETEKPELKNEEKPVITANRVCRRHGGMDWDDSRYKRKRYEKKYF